MVLFYFKSRERQKVFIEDQKKIIETLLFLKQLKLMPYFKKWLSDIEKGDTHPLGDCWKVFRENENTLRIYWRMGIHNEWAEAFGFYHDCVKWSTQCISTERINKLFPSLIDELLAEVSPC